MAFRRTKLALVGLFTGSIILAGAMMMPGSVARAQVPQPSVAPTSWELNFKYHAPERLILQTPNGPQTWWYMRYTVTNNSGQDVLFTPDFILMTDTGQIVKAPLTVPKTVFEQIKSLYNNAFLESPVQVLGRILQGDDNAKDGVAIWPAFDPNARRIQILVTGLSGETAVVKDPLTDKPAYLQKTLELTYDIPGQAIGIKPQPQFKGQKWVMR